MGVAVLQFCSYPLCSAKVLRGYCSQHQFEQTRTQEQHRENYAVRRWYRTARWRHPVWGRRAVQLRNHPYCADCLEREHYSEATDVHHIRKHHGDPGLFWDPKNLMSLCHGCHSLRTNRGE